MNMTFSIFQIFTYNQRITNTHIRGCNFFICTSLLSKIEKLEFVAGNTCKKVSMKIHNTDKLWVRYYTATYSPFTEFANLVLEYSFKTNRKSKSKQMNIYVSCIIVLYYIMQ